MSKPIFDRLNALIKETDRVAVFIDAYSTTNAASTINLTIDWGKFHSLFFEVSRLRRMGYYLSVTEPEEGKPQWWIKLADWLSYHGYKVVVSKSKLVVHKDNPERTDVMSDIAVQLSIDAMAVADSVDHVILLSGDSAYIPLLKALQNKNVVTTVVTNTYEQVRRIRNSDMSNAYIASKELIKHADNLFDLAEFRGEITKLEDDIAPAA